MTKRYSVFEDPHDRDMQSSVAFMVYNLAI